VFSRSRQLSLSSAICIQPTSSHFISLRSILILSYYLPTGLPSVLFPSGLPTKIFYAFLMSPIRVTCPAHLILLDFITLIVLVEAYKSWSSSLRSLLQSVVPPSPLGPNILLSTLFHTPHCTFFP
jgi:hypothetical protein